MVAFRPIASPTIASPVPMSVRVIAPTALPSDRLKINPANQWPS
ncbi:hypothetical protein A2U01_0109752, partial [Trifolium medium]|nr:hypothetical protein [Trifolium medium]